jgi:hypothetical protein
VSDCDDGWSRMYKYSDEVGVEYSDSSIKSVVVQ